MLRYIFFGLVALSFFVTGWNGHYFSVYTGVMGAILNAVLMLLLYAIVRALLWPFRRREGERPASPDPSPENM